MKKYTIARYSLERITVTANSEEEAIAKAKETDPQEWYIDEGGYSVVDAEDE